MKKLRKAVVGPTESQIQAVILDWLNHLTQCKAWRNNVIPVYNARSGRYQKMPKWSNVGSADILGVYRGYFLAIEVKRPKGRLSEHQKVWLTEMVELGAIAFVARSLEDVQIVLQQIDAGIDFTAVQTQGEVC